MAIGETYTATVEHIAAGGAGILHREGISIFIDLTAPGDTVRFRIVEEHRGWARGELLEVIEASPQRAAPPCPLYGRCGGCSLQHLSYDTQVAEKTAIFRDAFLHIGGFGPPSLPEIRVYPSPPFEYRNRVQLHCVSGEASGTKADRKPGKRRGRLPHGRPEAEERREAALVNRAQVGFRERGAAGRIPVTDCPVADPLIRRGLREGQLIPPPEKDRFTVYGKGDILLSEGGKRRGKVNLRGRELLADAGVFFQSNAAMTELLLGDLLAIAGRGNRDLPLADIYCGVGTFAFFLGELFPRIDLVEENKTALALARENIGGISNEATSAALSRGADHRFYAISDDGWVKSREGKTEPYGFMVLDPPRTGLSSLLRRHLAEAGPPLLAYVSCNPATLARDSRDLAAGGYALTELGFYDFYPQTAHIEGLAVFERDTPAGTHG